MLFLLSSSWSPGKGIVGVEGMQMYIIYSDIYRYVPEANAQTAEQANTVVTSACQELLEHIVSL